MKLGIVGIAFILNVLADDSAEKSVPTAKRRYEYKQSLKKPYKIENKVPGYVTLDGTTVAEHFIRLSSSIPGSRGSLWATEPNQFTEWEVEYAFQVSGRGAHGKDGLAFWYTQEHSEPGPVLGNRDEWTGLAIMHDTYDKIQETVSPYILGIDNDGTKKASNVSNVLSLMFGGCFRDFRNSMVPVHVRVTYAENNLKVAVDSTQNGKSFLPCFERLDIKLPTGYYFGFSASSSYPADDHDLFRFSVYELNPSRPDHDMSRPFEKEGKFELDKEKLEKIERLKKEIESHFTPNEDDDDPLAEEVPNFREHGLQETQFRILESLNAVHKKLEGLESKAGISPVSGAPSDGTVNAKLQSEIHALTARVKETTSSINEIRDSLKKITSQLQDIEKEGPRDMQSIRTEFMSLSHKIDSVLHHSQTENANVGSKLDSVASYLWYIFLMASLGAALALGYTAYLAKDRRQSKKYI